MSQHYVFLRPLFAFFLVFLLAGAQAQSLTELLPAETFFALGTEGLSDHRDKLQPFIDEFERLELGDALSTLMAKEEDSGAEALGDLEQQLEGLTAFDLLGQEAWLAVSASSFNPLPALTLVARLSPEASARAEALLAEAAAEEGVEALSEGDYSFYQQRLEAEGDEAMAGQVLAFAQVDDLVALSSNPDTMRGVLRQLGGSSDPDFSSSQGYAATLGALEAGAFYSYLDYAQVAQILSPFASNLGFDALLERLVSAFTTAGVQASVLRLTDAGMESQGVQVPNPEGGDAELYALLTEGAPSDTAAVQLAPADALSLSSSSVNLRGWWDYLNGLAASSPELGGDLDELLMSFLGLDLRSTFFDWTSGQLTTVTTGVGELAEPGVASSNLLGDMVFSLSTDDEAAAQAGLAALIGSLSSQIAMFTDPSGGMGAAETSTRELAGVTVTSYDISDGISLATAVTGGQVLIATSPSAMDAALSARAAGDAQAFSGLLERVPDDATGFSLANNRATLEGTARQLASQIQLTAGLSGAAELDFEAVEALSGKLESYLLFIAERLGDSVSYQQKTAGRIVSTGETQVSW